MDLDKIVWSGSGLASITVGVTGLRKNFSRDCGIEECYWRPSQQVFWGILRGFYYVVSSPVLPFLVGAALRKLNAIKLTWQLLINSTSMLWNRLSFQHLLKFFFLIHWFLYHLIPTNQSMTQKITEINK